jgi:hypothetical protein
VNAGEWRNQLAAVDARRPWFAPYAQAFVHLQRAIAEGGDAATALSSCSASEAGPPRFASFRGLPPSEAYESFVARTRTVPTRDNLHDFFNGLIWLHYPLAKRRLNELQTAQIAANGAAGPRGAVRDAITVFDENGALLDAPAALWDALLARDWKLAFVHSRPLWAQARLWIFGHALLDKLVQPRKEITAHVWRFACPTGAGMAELDRWLAAQLDPETLACKPFVPLPLLGIPGWCEENRQVSFYDDPSVFRPGDPAVARSTRAALRALDLPGPNLI